MPPLNSAPDTDANTNSPATITDVAESTAGESSIRRSQRPRKEINYSTKVHSDFDKVFRPTYFAKQTGRPPLPSRKRRFSESSEASTVSTNSVSSTCTYESTKSNPPNLNRTEDQSEVEAPTVRLPDPKATRRSSRQEALKYHSYDTKKHPQDPYLPWRRGTKPSRESSTPGDTPDAANPTITMFDVGESPMQASEPPFKRSKQTRDSAESLGDSAVSGLDSRRAGAAVVLSVRSSPAAQDQDEEEDMDESEDEEGDDKEEAELDYDTRTLDKLHATSQELFGAVGPESTAAGRHGSRVVEQGHLSNGTPDVEKPLESIETAPELLPDNSVLAAQQMRESFSDEILAPAPAVELARPTGSSNASNFDVIQHHLKALEAMGYRVSGISAAIHPTSTADGFARPDRSNNVVWTPASSLFTALNSTAPLASTTQRSGPSSPVHMPGAEQAPQHTQTEKLSPRSSHHGITTDQGAPTSSTLALTSSQRHRYTGRPSHLGLKPQASIEIYDSEGEDTSTPSLHLQLRNSSRDGQREEEEPEHTP
ncbi:hypothetical protein B9Z65_3738 [Elsinoe australis]|uniref:Uncharacterized protein n=1 Tax=Elsinoe australis TaxID=40998 RepID=A0A2P8AG22_9PEZI|nr:hypothetical protein B9Z65_3738 [Elsinoe australis]